MSEPLDIEDVYHFTVRYVHCRHCLGWDEYYEGIQPPRRTIGGRIIDTEPRPNGLTLRGRTHHRRTCGRDA